MPAATDHRNEGHEKGARSPVRILSREFVSMPLLGGEAWLGSTGLAETDVLTQRRDHANVVGSGGTNIRRELDYVKAGVRPH